MEYHGTFLYGIFTLNNIPYNNHRMALKKGRAKHFKKHLSVFIFSKTAEDFKKDICRIFKIKIYYWI